MQFNDAYNLPAGVLHSLYRIVFERSQQEKEQAAKEEEERKKAEELKERHPSSNIQVSSPSIPSNVQDQIEETMEEGM